MITKYENNKIKITADFIITSINAATVLMEYLKKINNEDGILVTSVDELNTIADEIKNLKKLPEK